MEATSVVYCDEPNRPVFAISVSGVRCPQDFYDGYTSSGT